MDTEKIIEDLNRRFAAPLPEFYKRRIIFWYDEKKEFADELDEIKIDNVKIIALTGKNNFYVKKLLNKDDTTSNYLVYSPLTYENPEDDWLLDIELYSEEFRADLISMWMDEMGVQQTIDLRSGFNKYRKFLNAQSRRNKIIALGIVPAKTSHLQVAIMAILAGLKVAKPNAIIRAVLQNGLDKEKNSVYQEFVNYGIDDVFWRMVAQGYGYHEDDPDLKQLAAHLLLTASARTLRQEYLKGLESHISSSRQAYCYDFISEWMHSEDSDKIHAIAKTIEEELNLGKRFMKLEVADLLDTEIFPCIHKIIIIKLMKEISDHIIDIDTIQKTVEKRRTCVWYSEVKNYYECVCLVAKMQAFYKEHSAGFHTVEPAKIWEEYTAEYYLMDTYYRKFHVLYSEIITHYNHKKLDDYVKSVKDKVEGLYVTWFLGQLGKNWSDACADEMENNGIIQGIPQQARFYKQHVAKVDSKVYVIISDAMRYEVAVSLSELLRRGTQAEVNLKSMQAVFPTITPFGMAALLPHNELSVELKTGKTERIAVLADGQSTESNNRNKILKGENEASVALKYDDILPMKRADRQALVKGMNVIYIYHDTIDKAGHSGTSVFKACDATIDELKNMVRIITNEWGGTNILITSDHGFLYTYDELKEDDKLDKTGFADRIIEYGRRYAIMMKDSNPDYLQKVKFLDGNTEYEGFTPKEDIRIKINKSDPKFVHGGISLQEMVVPVIDYHFLRNDYKEYQQNKSKYDTKPVEIGLLSASRKITNLIFSLNFYQKEAVGGNREEATYKLYFTDSNGETISDTAIIIADKTGDNEQDRIFRVSFNLKSMKYSNTDTYFLVIEDEEGMPEKREEFHIDIAFAVDEFDFF